MSRDSLVSHWLHNEVLPLLFDTILHTNLSPGSVIDVAVKYSTRVESCTEHQHVKATSPHLILAYTTRHQNQTQLLVPLFHSPRKLFASSQDTLLPRSLDPIG
jgi:hypothetical protein